MKIFGRLMKSGLALCLLLCSVFIFTSCSGQKHDEVKIAIAWRADTDSEFCRNVVNSFAEAGVQVVILDQVKASYVQYDGEIVSATCIDLMS